VTQALQPGDLRPNFGYRLGAFLSNLAGIFQPKTIVLSGGITELYWDEFKSSLRSEFSQSKPDWLEEPQIRSSPYGKNAALRGMAKYW
jgi:predicted NBD/HSP70 family sugar kinase